MRILTQTPTVILTITLNLTVTLYLTLTQGRLSRPGSGHSSCPVKNEMGKSSESVQCAITGPCLRMRHRLSA